MAGATSYTCGSCGAALSDVDGTASKGYVKCRFCGEVTDVTAPPPATATRGAVPPPRAAPPRAPGARRHIRVQPRDSTLPVPKGFEVDSDATTMRIVKRWRTAAVGCLVVFAVFWNAFLVLWNLGVSQAGGIAIVFHLFSIPFVLVGLGLIYLCAATFVNRTTITASASVLSVRVGPLPWRGNLDVDPSEIEQLYVETKTRSSKNGTSSWSVVAVRMRGGVRRTLVGSVRTADDAAFVVETLEAFLGLPPAAPVPTPEPAPEPEDDATPDDDDLPPA